MDSGMVQVHVEAPPDAVYDLVSDVTRMGEWSPECHTCEWLDGATGPVKGARFKGSNKAGVARWSTTCTVEVADRGREFTFDNGRTRWIYRMEPANGGTVLTEAYEAHKPLPRIADWLGKILSPGRDMAANLRASLERVKTIAERGT